MLSDANKNLIITYTIAIVIGAGLIFVIKNFNSWFFPNNEAKLNVYTTSSRGIISEKDLNFGVLSDKKFISLEPILDQSEITEEPVTPEPGTVTSPVKSALELRRGNPFIPF